MQTKFISSLAARFFDLVSAEHKNGEYIYSLKEAAARNNVVGAALEAADAGEIRRVEKRIGEAQVDMFYDAADAAVVGLELSRNMKHRIFLEYFQRYIQSDALVYPDCARVTHAPKA